VLLKGYVALNAVCSPELAPREPIADVIDIGWLADSPPPLNLMFILRVNLQVKLTGMPNAPQARQSDSV